MTRYTQRSARHHRELPQQPCGRPHLHPTEPKAVEPLSPTPLHTYAPPFGKRLEALRLAVREARGEVVGQAAGSAAAAAAGWGEALGRIVHRLALPPAAAWGLRTLALAFFRLALLCPAESPRAASATPTVAGPRHRMQNREGKLRP
jgi:hypothetical protein